MPFLCVADTAPTAGVGIAGLARGLHNVVDLQQHAHRLGRQVQRAERHQQRLHNVLLQDVGDGALREQSQVLATATHHAHREEDGRRARAVRHRDGCCSTHV